MKKVWILEKFASHDDMVNTYEELKTIAEMFKNDITKKPEEIAEFKVGLANYEKRMNENPNGYWYGFEGKIIYRQFCDVAKAAIRRNPEGKFRVVEGEIEDGAKYWAGYKMTKVNDGVLRYLMATK